MVRALEPRGYLRKWGIRGHRPLPSMCQLSAKLTHKKWDRALSNWLFINIRGLSSPEFGCGMVICGASFRGGNG